MHEKTFKKRETGTSGDSATVDPGLHKSLKFEPIDNSIYDGPDRPMSLDLVYSCLDRQTPLVHFRPVSQQPDEDIVIQRQDGGARPGLVSHSRADSTVITAGPGNALPSASVKEFKNVGSE